MLVFMAFPRDVLGCSAGVPTQQPVEGRGLDARGPSLEGADSWDLVPAADNSGTRPRR